MIELGSNSIQAFGGLVSKQLNFPFSHFPVYRTLNKKFDKGKYRQSEVLYLKSPNTAA